MNEASSTLFSPCPLCREGTVAAARPNLYRCSVCGAEFAPAGNDRYKLVHCEPTYQIGQELACICRERILTHCLLGRIASKTEWEQMARGEELPAYRKYEELKRRFQSGNLPEEPATVAITPLREREIVHRVSRPVYTDEVHYRSKGQRVDEGALMLTNQRLVYKRGTHILDIALDEIAQVEAAPPGFVVVVGRDREHHYFYPPPLDPIFDALRAALGKKAA